MLILHYPQCGTCRKALKWLDEHRPMLVVDRRHIVEHRPTVEELTEWIERSGLPVSKFFNTSGLVYKELGLKDVVKTASREALIALLAENGKLVKRPLLVGDDRVLVGFKESEWEQLLQTD